MNPPVESVEGFGGGYYLVPEAELRKYGGDTVVAPRDFILELCHYVTAPLIKIGGRHYWLQPEWGIPSETIAIPEGVEINDGEEVLLAKDSATASLVGTGIVDPP